MKEYLRRAAWWVRTTRTTQFPFFDAAAVDPTVRADAAVVARIEAHLDSEGIGRQVTTACARALHFAALVDAGVPLPDAPAEPFEPLLVMFERGGGFRVEGGGYIDVDFIGVRIGTIDDNLRPDPIVRLDRAVLDAIDDQSPF